METNPGAPGSPHSHTSATSQSLWPEAKDGGRSSAADWEYCAELLSIMNLGKLREHDRALSLTGLAQKNLRCSPCGECVEPRSIAHCDTL